MKRDLPNKDLPAIILAILADEPAHGYAIARRVEEISENLLRMREGSLYPALRILEQDRLITAQWENPPTGPARKVYSLTASGRTEMAKRTKELRQYVSLIETILGRVGHVQSA
ncbi:MAG TPA: helix-turn-helix transcriptional regulator [Capsulimonadaceae bacterium]|nr:helix-turn-helix transcriptional regulator [Capsulimonadaceae bacterium]